MGVKDFPVPEIWKDIANFEGYFQVSNLGRIRSLERKVPNKGGFFKNLKGQIRKTVKDEKGYYRVTLRYKGTISSPLVHRLVAATFYGDSELHVNHKNGNRSDNCLTNLEFVTSLENNNHRCTVLKNQKRFGVREVPYPAKWRVDIRVGKKKKFIGVYFNKEEAYDAFHHEYLKIHGVAPWEK